MSLAPVLCVFGTASDVGKSIVVSALCRLLRDLGKNVAPYKAQNMSNNSGVTIAGLEMGRAQFVQALAAGVEPNVDMNPVLLKPSGDRTSQIVLSGKAIGTSTAREYFSKRSSLREPAFAALSRLRERHEVVVVEGAGSCAEVNLRAREFVNFPVAHHADAAVLLVADIERGGVFAQVVGSLEVMLPEDRARVRGVLINRFRGDPRLFEEGVEFLERRTGLPVLGVLPYAPDLRIESEDGLGLQALVDPPIGADSDGRVRIAVLRLPRISNFTDFEPWDSCPHVEVHYLSRLRELDAYDLVVVPGSKAVQADLQWLQQTGWEQQLHRRRAAKGKIVGICGGYQMLGTRLKDPHGLEGTAGEYEGLGLLDVVTVFEKEKVVRRTRTTSEFLNAELSGYEIHMGCSQSGERPLSRGVRHLPEEPGLSADRCEGAVSEDGTVIGTYLHGLFDETVALRAWLKWISSTAAEELRTELVLGYQREEQLDALARHFSEHVDMARLLQAMGGELRRVLT